MLVLIVEDDKKAYRTAWTAWGGARHEEERDKPQIPGPIMKSSSMLTFPSSTRNFMDIPGFSHLRVFNVSTEWFCYFDNFASPGIVRNTE